MSRRDLNWQPFEIKAKTYTAPSGSIIAFVMVWWGPWMLFCFTVPELNQEMAISDLKLKFLGRFGSYSSALDAVAKEMDSRL